MDVLGPLPEPTGRLLLPVLSLCSLVPLPPEFPPLPAPEAAPPAACLSSRLAGLCEAFFDGVARFASGVGSAVPKVPEVTASSGSLSTVSAVLPPAVVRAAVWSLPRLLIRNGTDTRSAPAMAAAASIGRDGRPGWPA